MENRPGDCCWNGLAGACHLFGIVTTLALWGVGVEYVYFGTIFGIYFMSNILVGLMSLSSPFVILSIIALVTSFLEVVFLLNHVVEACVSRPSSFERFWDVVLWLDDWKKGGLYFALFAPPCFVRPAEVVLGIPAGCLLIVTGVLYMLKTFKTKRDEENVSYLQNASYDRFQDEDVPVDIEDDITNPTNSPINGLTSVADQSDVLDL